MTVLITGATGFVGTQLTEHLLAQGRAVRVVARRHAPGRSERAQRLLQRRDVDVVEADLGDRRAVIEAVRGVDVVYHLAWQSRPSLQPGGWRPPSEGHGSSNIEDAERLLSACARHGVKRFVYTSTVAVYGNTSSPARWPVREEDALEPGVGASSHFARHYIEPKLLIEDMIREHAQRADMRFVVLRPSIVYGAGARFAQPWVRRALRPAPAAGLLAMQMVHVRDVADALVLALAPGAANETINVAGAEVATVAALESMIRASAFPDLRGLPNRGSAAGAALGARRPQLLRYDLSRAAAILRFAPRVPLAEGIPEMVGAALREMMPWGGGSRAEFRTRPPHAHAGQVRGWDGAAAWPAAGPGSGRDRP